MGKKSRSKRNHTPAQPKPASPAQAPAQAAAAAAAGGFMPASLQQKSGSAAPSQPKQSNPKAPALTLDASTEFIRQDIARILLLLLVVALILIILTVLSAHSSFLSDLGKRLASFAHLQ